MWTWKIIIRIFAEQEGEDANAHEEPSTPRRFHSDGSYPAFWPVGNGGSRCASSFAASPVQPAEWQSRPLGRYGAPHRKSFWGKDGHAHADAGLLRYRPDPQA